MTALHEALADLVPLVAAQLHKTYRRLPAEDIAGAMWIRVYERPEWFGEQVQAGRFGLMREELRRAGWRACKDDEREQRAKKAAAGGYDPEDEQFYPLGLLRALLPAFLDGGVAEEPPKQAGSRGGSLKSERGDYLTMMCDLGTGMAAIAPHERRIITQWFALPQGDDTDSRFTRSQFASTQGLTLNAMEQRVTRALRALQAKLGGDNPWRRPPLEYAVSSATGRTAPGSPSKSQRERLRS